MEVRTDQLECAGRALAAALVHRDRETVAALLRAAAKYLDGSTEAGGVRADLRLTPGGGTAWRPQR